MMSMLLREIWKFHKFVLLILGINIILSFSFGKAIFESHQSAFGNSLAIVELLKGYDRTVIGDWLNSESGLFSQITSTSVNFTLVSLMIQFLLNIGLVACIAKKEYNFNYFFKNIIKYFFPFLLLTLFFLVCLCAVIGIVSLILIQIFSEGFGSFTTELPLFYGSIGSIIFVMLVGGILWAFVIKAKMMRTNHSLLESLKNSLKFCKENFKKLLILAGLTILFFLTTSYLLNNYIIYNSGISSVLTIVCGIFGLFLLYFKILFKICILYFVDSIK
jgi:hypothetical protein